MNSLTSNKKCDLCTDPDTSNNPIFTCIDCDVSVHVLCYGILNEEKENWKCSPCENGCTEHVSCELCLQKKGALKQTTSGKWVHTICALFTDGVIFVDFERMEPIDISKVSKTKRGQTCAYCLEIKGYCCWCSRQKCKNRIHITCAQKAKGLKEYINEDDSIKFRAYCGDHKPVNRRLSSVSVRGMAKKKKDDDKKRKEIGSRMNADWIMSQTNSKSKSENFMTNAAPKQIQSKRTAPTSDGTDDAAHKKPKLSPPGIEGKFS